MKKILIATYILLYFNNTSFSQNVACTGITANGSIQILGDDINLCNDGAHLYLNVIGGGIAGYNGTDSYTVVQNANYNPSPLVMPNTVPSTYSGAVDLETEDDGWSSEITLPFQFCFFGQLYNKCLISNNGQVNFDVTQANSFNSWTIGGNLPFNAPNINNCILSPLHDIDGNINLGSKITYGVLGVAPCRKFVVSWFDRPMFSCNNLSCTQQVVMYEGTNEIEINIGTKLVCTGWSGGNAWEGIQNATGTVAYTVPGRNGGQWLANNDSWAFLPAGAPDTNNTIYWMDSATNVCLDTGLTFDYYPNFDMAVYVIIGDTTPGQGCGNIQSPFKHIYVQTAYVNWTSILAPTCDAGSATFTITNTNATDFIWDFGDGTIVNSTSTSITHTYTTQGPFTVTCSVNVGNCNGSQSNSILFIPPPLIADFTTSKISYCSGGIATFNIINTQNTNLYYWNFGDGQTSLPSANLTLTHTYVGLGPFIAKLYFAGTSGPCLDSISHPVLFTPVPINAVFSASPDSSCLGTPISISNTSSGGTGGLSYSWNWGNNSPLGTGTNPTYTYPTSGTYTITVTAADAYNCTKTFTDVVFVDSPAVINVSASQVLSCVGLPIFFTNTVSKSVTNYWLDVNDNNTKFYNQPLVDYTYITAGDYTVKLSAQTKKCPTVTDDITVHIDNYPILELGGPQQICAGRDELTIGDNLNSGATYLWSTGATTNTIVATASGTYTLSAKFNACETISTKEILGDITCIFKPNAFTPNNDGNNDYFNIVDSRNKDISYYKMQIYNRYGQRLYVSENKFEKGWDGKYFGEPCELGTYMYMITLELRDGAKQTFTGDFTLVR